MGKVRDFDGRWVGEGGGGPKDSQHGPFWRMSALFGTRDTETGFVSAHCLCQ